MTLLQQVVSYSMAYGFCVGVLVGAIAVMALLP